MSVLKLFGFEDLQDLKARLAQVSPEQVSNPQQKKQLKRLQAKQGGFSWLELLVVVAIMATIAAGTAIMINSADKNAKAAVHAAAADGLFKSIATFKVLNNVYPDKFDSLLYSVLGTNVDGVPATILSAGLTPMFLSQTPGVLTAGEILSLKNVGINQVSVIDGTKSAANCVDDGTKVQAYINDKTKKILVSNIFKVGDGGTTLGNGCGTLVTIGALTFHLKLSVAAVARVNGIAGHTLVPLGVGSNSNLFDPNKSGALARPPHYSNLKTDQYNQFVAVFDATPTDAALVAVITPKGETFEDELAIWEGAA